MANVTEIVFIIYITVALITVKLGISWQGPIGSICHQNIFTCTSLA